MIFLCQFLHFDALLLGPDNFELRVTIYSISLEAIVNSFVISFETSLPGVVGHMVLLLCLNFAVPSTMGSPPLDHVVKDRESIQSPFGKVLAGFAVNIEIFSCCLLLMPFYTSTFHQTNVENSQIRSEDNLLISRIRSRHLFSR